MPEWIQYLSRRNPNFLFFGLTLFCITFSSSSLPAQPRVKFKRYTTEDGLSHSYIFCMLQDSRGLMWFGTEDGLNKFDGYRFTQYRNISNDVNSLSYNNIRALYEDKQGRIWAGTLTGDLNCFNRNSESFARIKIPFPNNINRNQRIITAIVEDQQGTLWVGTGGAGLYYRKREGKKFSLFTHDPINKQSLSHNYINSLAIDQKGNLWIGTRSGLNRYDYSNNKFIRYQHNPFDVKSIRNDTITVLVPGRNGKLWIGTTKGIDWYDTTQGQLYHFGTALPEACKLDTIEVIAIREDMQNNLWITIPQGLLKFDAKTQCFQRFVHNPIDLQSISGTTFYGIVVDQEGGVWIGTRSGVNRYDAKLHHFRHYSNDPGNPHSLPHGGIWGFKQDQTGLLWITTETSRQPFDIQKGVIPANELNPIINEHVIKPDRKFLLEDRQGNIWTGPEGLYAINRKTGRARKFYHDPTNPNSLGHNTVWRGYESKDGLLWFKTRTGMSIFNPVTETFENYYYDPPDGTSFGSSSVTDFFEDRAGTMWLGMRGSGLVHVDRKTKQFIHFQHDPNDTTSISDDVIHVIHEDYLGRLWISTPSGLNLMLDKEKGIFRRIREKDGLPNEHLFGILEDKQHRLWMSSNKGIARYNPETGAFRNYDIADGISGNDFNDDSYYQDPRNGEMFFGSGKGFTVFHPDSIRDDTFIPPVVINRFQYLVRGKDGAVLTEEKGISEKKEITLTHQQKTLLLFEFASLSFSKTGKNQYKYQLKGYSDDWVLLGTRREASFTNLAPGHYTLRVQGSNGDGVWNETATELKIRILPPWYWAWWTKSLYALLLIGAIYYLYRFQLNRRLALERAELAEEKEQLAQERNQQLEELDTAKTRLYTNITHEFRTPLTIILGMADKVEQSPRQWLPEGIQMIKRNGKNLLRLVNQMLDLSKLDAGAMPVQLIQGDIVTYLRTLLELFRSYAESKNIKMHFESEAEQIVMDYDPDKIKDIISNLLSNAIKFTPEGGNVKLEVRSTRYEAQDVLQTSYLVLRVSDTGEGIPPEKLPHIFERFYLGDDSATRRSAGTGIGLALTQELVKLLGGEITASSAFREGAVFQVRLPISNEAPWAEPPSFEKFPTPETQTPILIEHTRKELPVVLIVEDNADVMTYLSTCLQNQYRIEVAYNGQEGIDKAIEIVPDVIISDVMMPEKDGFELCQTLKNDMRTSHIPIILLTARADMDSRLEGLEGGADAYLTKPFNQQELEISLRKSLELRQRLRERYAKDPFVPPLPNKNFAQDDAFVKAFHELVVKEHNNDKFNIEVMATTMGLSHATLGRKVNALLNISPKQYLQKYRLNKARHLILHTNKPIQDIAYETGFSSLQRFSNAFLEEFQQRPSDLR